MKIQLKKLLSNQELKSELIAQKAELRALSDAVKAHVPNKRVNWYMIGLAVLNVVTLISVLLQ